MMNVVHIKGIHPSPKAWLAIISVEMLLILGLLGLGFWTWSQSRTQHQICQAFQFIGDRTQQQINLTAVRLKTDLAKGDKTAITLDRKSISDATSFLIRVQRVQC